MAKAEQKKQQKQQKQNKRVTKEALSETSRRKKTRGATRAPNKVEREPLRWGRYVVAVFCVGCIGFGLSQINWQAVTSKASTVAHRPVKSVIIEGEFVFISKDKIQNILTERLTGDFVDINLRQIKSSIESNPWIHSVNIERVWPDSLKVKINEERPIARWGETGFINREGVLVKAEIGQLLNNLPLLSGVEAKSVELTQNYLLFTKLLSKSDFKVAGLSIDEKYSWEILLDKNIRLKLGQGDIQKKLENFLFVYETHLKKTMKVAGSIDNKRIKAIDMRYDQGMAVQWDTVADNNKREDSLTKNEKLAVAH